MSGEAVVFGRCRAPLREPARCQLTIDAVTAVQQPLVAVTGISTSTSTGASTGTSTQQHRTNSCDDSLRPGEA